MGKCKQIRLENNPISLCFISEGGSWWRVSPEIGQLKASGLYFIWWKIDCLSTKSKKKFFFTDCKKRIIAALDKIFVDFYHVLEQFSFTVNKTKIDYYITERWIYNLPYPNNIRLKSLMKWNLIMKFQENPWNA